MIRTCDLCPPAAEALGLLELPEDSCRRVVVFSGDVLPIPGFPTVGSGLRAWGLGHGLRAHGHDVLFSMPFAALDQLRRTVEISEDAEALAWRPFDMSTVIEQLEPDVAVVCGWALIENLAQEPFLAVPVVLDQHGPHVLERRYQALGKEEANARQKRRALAAADYFVCAGGRQLGYFQPWLTEAGWSDRERSERSFALPFSLSPNLPEHCPDDELTFVYGGVWLPWQDPTNGLTALVDQLDRRRRGRLRLFGGKHPWMKVDTGVFEMLMSRLEQSAHVVRVGQVAHAELISMYTRAHVAWDLMKRNLERELAFTSRTVEYLWCGLPVVYNDYSELSALIDEYDAGWTLDPEDVSSIHAVLDEIFDEPHVVARKSGNAQRLVRERLTWDRTVHALDEVVRRPSPRPNVRPFPRSSRRLTLRAQFQGAYAVGGLREVAAGAIRVTRSRLRQARRRTGT